MTSTTDRAMTVSASIPDAESTDEGRLPFGWDLVPLEQICTFASGGTPSKNRPEFWNGNVPWASPKDLKVARLRDTEDHISPAGLRAGSSLAPAHAVLVVVRGMILVRDIPMTLTEVPIAFNQDLKAVIPGDRVNPEYLLYAMLAFKANLFQRIGRSAHGTRTLLSNELAEFCIPVAPLDEQKRIAAILSLVKRAIATEEKAIAAIRELRTATLTQVFTKGLRGESKHETEIGPLPRSWGLRPLAELREFLQYGTSEKCDYAADGNPVLRIPNIVDGHIDYRDLKRCRLDAGVAASLRLERGDVLFIRTNGVRERVGTCAVYDGEPEEALFASYLIRARPKRSILNPRYLQYYTATAVGMSFLSGRSSPAADGKFNINMKNIDSVLVPVPAIDEQDEIVGLLQKIEASGRHHLRTRTVLTELFNALLKKLLSGGIRVDDVEVDVSRVAAA